MDRVDVVLRRGEIPGRDPPDARRRARPGARDRAAGPVRGNGRPDGARLPLQPERARVPDAPRRHLPDRQRRLDLRPPPAAGDRDAASGRGLRAGRSSAPSCRGARHRRRRHRCSAKVGGVLSRARPRWRRSRRPSRTSTSDGEDRGRGLRRSRASRGAPSGLIASLVGGDPPGRGGRRASARRRRCGQARSRGSGAARCAGAPSRPPPRSSPPRSCSRAGPIAGFPFLGFAAVALVVAALALVAPLLVRAAARARSRAPARAAVRGDRAGWRAASSAARSPATRSRSPRSPWRSA